MKKSTLEPSLEESFAIGKLMGEKEAFEEILEICKSISDSKHIRVYLEARIKSLKSNILNNPFKQKETKK